MKNSATIESLKGMRFGAMATELERQLQDPATYAHMGFEERVALLVDAEWNSRQNNKLIRCIREARFAEPGAAVEDIEYYEDRHLDKAQLLRFTTCDFISKGHHIIFKGASGNGKTYLACAMGNAACRKLLSVRYIRLPELLEELSLAQAAGELKKAIKSYQKYDLLILDEWLIRCLTPQESYNLLEVIEARCNKGSMIFCTQYEPGDWYERLHPNSEERSAIAEAILDRIIHNAYDKTLRNVPTNTWELFYSKFCTENNLYSVKTTFAQFILPIILQSSHTFSTQITEFAFTTVHKILADDNMCYYEWDKLSKLLPNVAWYNSWDKCKRLRKAAKMRNYNIAF